MAFVLKDRVKETSTTTGTGTFTLGGASPGYQGFSTIGNANTTFYSIVMGTEWENGVGTYTSSGSALSRDTVLSSSNSGNLVNFSAGTKDVFVNYPAGRATAYDTPSQSTGALHIPVGTTGERPTGASGMIRMNSTTGDPEWYDSAGAQWLKFSQAAQYSVEYLVVAGGGGGGGTDAAISGGGGGAGGFRTGSGFTVAPSSSYTVTVGAGGAGGNGTVGTSGANSVFSTITSNGGGGGGSAINARSGVSGGSGGGACQTGTAGSGNTPSTSPSQGNNGGAGSGSTGLNQWGGGGGGGASAVGSAASANIGGNGGDGTASSISGSSVTYAGGGGGGGYGTTSGTGGTGGGGNGGTGSGASSATANTGGGGGGVGTGGTGGAGGSGIVIIRYLGSQRGTGGTVTSSGGYTIHTFTSSGTFVA